jgi:hypothetical protein
MKGYLIAEIYSRRNTRILEHQLCTILLQNPLSRRYKYLQHIAVEDDAFPLIMYLIENYLTSTEFMKVAT